MQWQRFCNIHPSHGSNVMSCTWARYNFTVSLHASLCTASTGVQCCRTAHSIQRWILAEILCWRWMYMASMFVCKVMGCCAEDGVSWAFSEARSYLMCCVSMGFWARAHVLMNTASHATATPNFAYNYLKSLIELSFPWVQVWFDVLCLYGFLN